MSWLAAKTYTSFCKSFGYSVENYEIGLKINPRMRSFQANVSITLISAKRSREFCFLLSNQCTLDAVNYLGLALPHKIKSSYPGLNQITASLPRSADAGEKLVIVFMYSGLIPAHGGESMELPPEMHWYPFSLSPQKYTCTIKAITEESIRIISTGNYVSEQPANTKVMTQWTTAEPFRGMHLLAGEFLKTTREIQPVLDAYYPRKFMNQGKKLADLCEIAMVFLTEKLGPAPFPSFAYVITDNPAVSISSSFYLTSFSAGFFEELKDFGSSQDRTERLYYTIVRESVHRWLKNYLAINHPQHIWYLDGLAEYLGWLALEEEFDITCREAVMEEARSSVLTGAKESIQSAACGISREFPPWLVAKAGWIMRTAHCLTGDAFFPAIRDIIEHCQAIAPSPEEFFLTLGKLTATDFSLIYKEWIQSGEQLRAEIADARNFQDESGQWQLLFSLVNTGKLKWPLPIEIAMHLDDGSTQVHSLHVHEEPHLITTAAKITSLIVDPEKKFINWAEKNTYKL